MIWFAANVLEMPLDPWQQWLVIHLGEMLPDGRPRFRQVLVLVARQNGKTHLCVVLSLFWLYVEKWPLVFGTSTNLEQAAEPWEAAVDLTAAIPALAEQRAPDRSKGIRRTNGQQTLTTAHRTKYKIGAVSPRGGRGKSIDRIIGDELREHRTWAGYNAAYNAMNARPRGQAVYITNQGDAGSVVLNSLRTAALSGADPGAVDAGWNVALVAEDDRLGLFEWSAPDGIHPTDVRGHAAANPQLGRRMDHDTLMGPARRVSKPGADPEELAGFRTEMLCQAVKSMNHAIDMAMWGACNVPAEIDMSRPFGACIDVAVDGRHVTLAVAQVDGDGRTRAEVVASWATVHEATEAMVGWVKRNKPRAYGWFPGGPAAAMNADLKDRKKDGVRGWPPRGVRVAEIQGDTAAVCMSLAQLVRDDRFRHSGQDLLTAHAGNAERRARGNEGAWLFDRGEGGGHIDALYAVAGAVQLARTLPAGRGVPRMVMPAEA